MPIYVYACNQAGHERKEVVHPMQDSPVILCDCGGVMHRVPQAVMHYNNPTETLLDQMDEKYRQFRQRKARGHYARN